MGLCIHTHVISEKQNQTGRSMVEMLGVLAVVGVLSVAGIAGFKNAMDKNRANTIINEAQKRATLVVPQIQLIGNDSHTLNEFVNNDLGYAEFDTKVYTNKSDNLPAGQFGIKVSGVPQSICQNILNTIGDNTVIRRLSTTDAPTTPITTCGETNTFLMVYNNDMTSNAVAGEFGYDDCPESFHQCDTTHSCVSSENDCPRICELDEALSTGCVCPEHRDRTDDKCGNCVGESYENWNQPRLTSWNSYGTVTSSGDKSFEDFENCQERPVKGHVPWCLFDGRKDADHKWLVFENPADSSIVWSLPTTIRVQSMKIWQTTETCCLNRFPDEIAIYGSTDGNNWNLLTEDKNVSMPSSGSYWNFTCNSANCSQAYNYLKWRFIATDNWPAIAEIEITAQELKQTTHAPDSETLLCEE